MIIESNKDEETETIEVNKPSQIPRVGYLCVLGGILIHLMIGNLYLWGNISSYVLSYYHYKHDPLAIESMGVSVIPISQFM